VGGDGSEMKMKSAMATGYSVISVPIPMQVSDRPITVICSTKFAPISVVNGESNLKIVSACS